MSSIKDTSGSPYVRLEQGMFGPLPQLRAFLVTNSADAVGLNIKHREGGDWICVARRFSEDGLPQVCFGTGYDVIGALLGIEASIAAARWREDTPWKPRG